LLFYYLNTVFLLVISYKDIALQIFLTVAKPLITVTYYLVVCMTEQSKRHASGMMSPLACIADNTEQNSLITTKWPYK